MSDELMIFPLPLPYMNLQASSSTSSVRLQANYQWGHGPATERVGEGGQGGLEDDIGRGGKMLGQGSLHRAAFSRC